MKTIQSRFIYLTFLCFVHLNAQGQNKQVVKSYPVIDSLFKIRYEDPELSIELLEESYEMAINAKDTIKAINNLVVLANAYGHQAAYKNSYDNLWKALLLSDDINNDHLKITVYNELSRYYSFFRRREDALRYSHIAMDIARNLVRQNKLEEDELSTNYYNFAVVYRILEEPDMAGKYIDSCYGTITTVQNVEVFQPFWDYEKAYQYLINEEYQKALDIYLLHLPWYKEQYPGTQTLLYADMGEAYKGLGQYRKSEEAYLKAIQTSQKYNSHIDFSPLIYTKLSDLYKTQNRLAPAYASLKKAKELDRRFFDSRSVNNSPLLEIQDDFRLEQQRTTTLLNQNRLKELESSRRIWVLHRIILFLFIISLLIVGYMYYRHLRAKYTAEKALIRKKNELEVQKANELLEVKNKELATSTLKLIEKDEMLQNLKDRLTENKAGLDGQNVKKIARSIHVNNQQNWEEFETRFISVNKDFYEKLHERFPKLTAGEQKLCALIKLNFSSKHMASLMGISVASVHTSRYRLRKKFNLNREENLSDFIADI